MRSDCSLSSTATTSTLAVDDVDQSLAIVDLAREHFPRLELVARARDVTHWNRLRDRGVTRVEREVFESSLRSGRTVLEVLGQTPHEARQQAMRFRRHNMELFEKMHPHYQDRKRLIAVVKAGRRQLEEQMASERAENEARRKRGSERMPGWDGERSEGADAQLEERVPHQLEAGEQHADVDQPVKQ